MIIKIHLLQKEKIFFHYLKFVSCNSYRIHEPLNNIENFSFCEGKDYAYI
jgi:hypothetical protein